MALIRTLLLTLALASSLVFANEFRVADIQLLGNRTTKDWVLLRELRFGVGDVVSDADLEAARLRLLSLGIFNNVHVRQDSLNRVTVEVSEQYRYIPLLGASPAEGSFNDALNDPGRVMDIIVFSVGAADINHNGSGAAVGGFVEFGARSGVNLVYRTRWFSKRFPFAVDFGGRSLKVLDRHASVLGYSRRLRNDRVFLELGTRRGAPSRLGVALAYDAIQEEDNLPATGAHYDVGWIAPFVVLDRRNLEWYPTTGSFARGEIEQAVGKTSFTRSRAMIAAYLPFAKGARGPTLAARLYGGTSDRRTPNWAHFFFGFSSKFRGYSTEQMEAANYLSGECEFRFPITRETSYDVPAVGRYGKDIPFWIGGALFFERAQMQLDGTRNDIWAGGAALHVRVPYVQVMEFSLARNRANEFDVVFSTGVRF